MRSKYLKVQQTVSVISSWHLPVSLFSHRSLSTAAVDLWDVWVMLKYLCSTSLVHSSTVCSIRRVSSHLVAAQRQSSMLCLSSWNLTSDLLDNFSLQVTWPLTQCTVTWHKLFKVQVTSCCDIRCVWSIQTESSCFHRLKSILIKCLAEFTETSICWFEGPAGALKPDGSLNSVWDTLPGQQV